MRERCIRDHVKISDYSLLPLNEYLIRYVIFNEVLIFQHLIFLNTTKKLISRSSNVLTVLCRRLREAKEYEEELLTISMNVSHNKCREVSYRKKQI